MASTTSSTEPARPALTCYTCSHYPVCGLAKAIRAMLLNSDHIDIDGKHTPGKAKGVMVGLANCCTKYQAT